MPQGNGLGGVTSKNNVLINSKISMGFLTACKHANGKDWWLLVPKDSVEYYHRFLLTENGFVAYPSLQFSAPLVPFNSAGQAVFSPDGTKYAKIVLDIGKVYLYDFDRCKGELSNLEVLDAYVVPGGYCGGVAFSPNSKVLYASTAYSLYQFDVTASNVNDTRDTIAVWDGVYSPTATAFYLAQLAPDGKIYINSANSTDKLHIIHKPDSLGDACNVEQRGLHLPHLNSYSLPNFPHYRLGADTTKPCAVSSNQSAVISKQVLVYPNPAQEKVYIELPPSSETRQLYVYNAMGQLIYSQALRQELTQVFVGNWVKGLYFYEVIFKEGKVHGKLQVE